MGSFAGHVIPGVFFIFIGTWWWINVVWIHMKRLRKDELKSKGQSASFKSTTWFAVPVKKLRGIPLEPLLIMVFTIVGIFLELSRTSRWLVVSKDGEFVNLNNFAHISMYSGFFVWATVEVLLFYRALDLPTCFQHVFCSVALFVEGLLFYSHLDGRPELDQHLHVLLYVVIFATAFVLLLEAWMKTSFILLATRVYLTVLQGTWFVQIAHSLHGRRPWKNSSSNQAFVVIGFTWHVMVILGIFTVSVLFASCKARGCAFYRRKLLEIEMENIGEESESMRSLMEPEMEVQTDGLSKLNLY